jgi:hypothetical protein
MLTHHIIKLVIYLICLPSKYAMSGASEPAIILNLPVGSYTALVDGKGVEGKVVIGAFDLD